MNSGSWLLILTLLAAVPLPAQVADLKPRDEASANPSFVAFRAELLEAVERRDTSHVMDILVEDVRSSFGGSGGREEFRRMWFGSNRPGGESLWRVLERVLRNGGVFRNDSTFVAPYAFTLFPDTLDPFRYGAITGRGVRIRASPGLDGAILTHLSHAVVELRQWADPVQADGYGWVQVELADGRRGWVARTYVLSPVGYRAFFVRQDGAWRMQLLVAGD